MELPLMIVAAITAVVLLTAIKIVPEHERFAVYLLGRFVGFRGPGLVVKMTGPSKEWKRIKSGERGVLISDDVARFSAGDLPIRLDGRPTVGAYVKVTRFEKKRALAAIDPDQTRVVVCEQCGHENKV